MTDERMQQLELAVEALARHLFPGCPHCGGSNGGHMRWCSADGPRYESRCFGSLIRRAGEDQA